jgi:hypothetical protein
VPRTMERSSIGYATPVTRGEGRSDDSTVAKAHEGNRCLSRYRTSPEVTVTDIGDELVLLDLRTQNMHALDAVGRFVWLGLMESAPAAVATTVVVR